MNEVLEAVKLQSTTIKSPVTKCFPGCALSSIVHVYCIFSNNVRSIKLSMFCSDFRPPNNFVSIHRATKQNKKYKFTKRWHYYINSHIFNKLWSLNLLYVHNLLKDNVMGLKSTTKEQKYLWLAKNQQHARQEMVDYYFSEMSLDTKWAACKASPTDIVLLVPLSRFRLKTLGYM